jgi:hypothetical protein
MDYVCGPVILYSQDKVRMLDLLSDVFEFDVDVKSDIVSSGTMNFKLIEIRDELREEFKSTGIIFLFKIKKYDEFKEILSKFNFFLYRKNEGDNAQEALEFGEFEHKKTLSIKDVDGRTWRFDFENPL